MNLINHIDPPQENSQQYVVMYSPKSIENMETTTFPKNSSGHTKAFQKYIFKSFEGGFSFSHEFESVVQLDY